MYLQHPMKSDVFTTPMKSDVLTTPHEEGVVNTSLFMGSCKYMTLHGVL
jgi:hypothetical protein